MKITITILTIFTLFTIVSTVSAIKDRSIWDKSNPRNRKMITIDTSCLENFPSTKNPQCLEKAVPIKLSYLQILLFKMLIMLLVVSIMVIIFHMDPDTKAFLFAFMIVRSF